MKEEKYIQSLFESARNEEPQLSFEEASKTFEATLQPGFAESLKDWFFNHLNLNSIMIVTAIGVISTVLLLNLQQPNEAIEPLTNDHTITATEVGQLPTAKLPTDILPTDSIQPVTVTVETQNEIVEISMEADPEKIQIKKSPKPAKTIQPLESLTEGSIVEGISRKGDRIEMEPFKMAEVIAPGDLESGTREEPEYDDSQRDLRGNGELPKVSKRESTDGNSSSTYYARNPSRKNLIEELLELALDQEHLKNDIFEKKRDGEIRQLVLMTNGKFDHRLDVNVGGKKVILAPSVHAEGFQPLDPFIDLQAFDLESDECDIEFYYNRTKVHIILEKKNGHWYFFHSSTDHNDKDFLAKEHLLQNLLDDPYMRAVLDTTATGEYLPANILGQGHVSSSTEVFLGKHPVRIFPSSYHQDFDKRSQYMELTKFNIKRKKAKIGFLYKDGTVTVSFKKVNGHWEMRSLYHKSGSSNYKYERF